MILRLCTAILTIGFAASLTTPSQARTEADTVRTVQYMAWDVFCVKLGPAVRLPVGKDENYRAAMLRRADKGEHITREQLSAIEKREPLLGMGLCAIAAALGRPSRMNRTVGRFGEHYQLVYANPRRYVYLENGLVTSWQD